MKVRLLVAIVLTALVAIASHNDYADQRRDAGRAGGFVRELRDTQSNVEAPSEDSPGWNCNTQGDRRCYAGARVQYQA